MERGLWFTARFDGCNHLRYRSALFTSLTIKGAYQWTMGVFAAADAPRYFCYGAAVAKILIDLLIEFIAQFSVGFDRFHDAKLVYRQSRTSLRSGCHSSCIRALMHSGR